MLRISILFTIFFCTGMACFSQVKPEKNMGIKIILRDAADSAAIEGGTVEIYGHDNKLIIKGTSAGNGVFEASLAEPAQALKIYHQGYVAVDFKIGGRFSPITVMLTQKINGLNEVQVVKTRDKITDYGDKLVYNAEKDIDVGGTAVDILRKVPLVSIDANGTPSIKSNPSIKILINGRPSASQNPALVLKTIPSNQISKIEVITSPSAKYEADGTGGIINIITKTRLLPGLNGVINAGAGTKGSHVTGSAYYTKNKINLNFTYGSNWFYDRTSETTSLSGNYAGVVSPLFQQDANGRYTGSRSYYQLSANYSPNDNSTFGADLNYSNQSVFPKLKSSSVFYIPNLQIERDNESEQISNLTTSAIYFEHKFSDKQRLNIRTSYGFNNNRNNYSFSQTNNMSDLDQTFENKTSNRESDSQVDFETPVFKGKNLLEFGVRGIFRDMKSTYSQNDLVSGTPPDYLRNKQYILSAYVANNYKLTRLISIRAGVRMEKVNNELENRASSFISDYSNFFPNGGITFKISSTKNFSFNYNYRIRRPSIQYLNPAVNGSEVLVRYGGNPFLKPEYTSNFEFSFSTYISDNYLKVTPYLASTRDYISTFMSADNEGLIGRYSNIGRQRSIGINIWGTVNLLKGLTLNNSIDLVQRKLTSESMGIENRGLVVSETFNLLYELNKKYTLQYFGTYYSSKIELQGKQSSYSFSNVAFKYAFGSNRYSIAASVDNPFRKSFDYKINYDVNDTLRYSDETNFYDRGFRLIFNYSFGKGGQQNVIKRKAVDQDLKAKENQI